jgi:hypothetical protein
MNLLSPSRVGNETDNGEDQEDEEQDLRDTRCACGDAGKSEHGRNERDDEKDDCVMKHRYLRVCVAPLSVPAERIITVGRFPQCRFAGDKRVGID